MVTRRELPWLCCFAPKENWILCQYVLSRRGVPICRQHRCFILVDILPCNTPHRRDSIWRSVHGPCLTCGANDDNIRRLVTRPGDFPFLHSAVPSDPLEGVGWWLRNGVLSVEWRWCRGGRDSEEQFFFQHAMNVGRTVFSWATTFCHNPMILWS